jgi:hypothetical protein
MGFNRRKMEDQRRQAAEKEAAKRRATDAQVLEDTERLIAAWNERQAKRMPMLFSPTIGTAITAGYWFLWISCPVCRTINDRPATFVISICGQRTDSTNSTDNPRAATCKHCLRLLGIEK